MADSIIEITKALNDYGPALVVVAALLVLNSFFIWRDYLREARQQNQLDELHKAHNQIVLPLLTECKEAIGACREVIKQNSQIINDWITHGRG